MKTVKHTEEHSDWVYFDAKVKIHATGEVFITDEEKASLARAMEPDEAKEMRGCCDVTVTPCDDRPIQIAIPMELQCRMRRKQAEQLSNKDVRFMIEAELNAPWNKLHSSECKVSKLSNAITGVEVEQLSRSTMPSGYYETYLAEILGHEVANKSNEMGA